MMRSKLEVIVPDVIIEDAIRAYYKSLGTPIPKKISLVNLEGNGETAVFCTFESDDFYENS